MKLLVIGGCGYIGSTLCRYLAHSHEVDCLDAEWFGGQPNNYKIDFADIDKSYVEAYDAVILLAGHSSVSMCERDPVGAYHNNVTRFIDLAAKLHPDQKFIYASSGTVHGQSGSQPASEQQIGDPVNIYDVTKRAIDDYAAVSKLDYYGLRLGSVFGASPNLRTDLVINRCVREILAGRPAIIYGSEVWRPFLFINDICRAVDAILSHKPHPGVYNLSTKNMNMGTLSSILESLFQSEMVWKPQMPCYNFSLDCSKFCRTFDFAFSTDFEHKIWELHKHFAGMPSERP